MSSQLSHKLTGCFDNILLYYQNFALSPVELAGIVECATTGKSMKELFHDPNKGGT